MQSITEVNKMKIRKYIKADSTDTQIATKISENGTIFYRIPLQDVIKYYDNPKRNIWVWKSFVEEGWNCINFDNSLFGSAVDGSDLYLCVTDGMEIDVDGNAVDPEQALEEYDLDELSDYILPGNDGIIRRYITDSEIKTPKFDKWASDLIDDGYDFTSLVEDAMEFDDFSV